MSKPSRSEELPKGALPPLFTNPLRTGDQRRSKQRGNRNGSRHQLYVWRHSQCQSHPDRKSYLRGLYPPFSPTLYALAINVVPSNGGTVTGAGTNYTSGVTANVKAIPRSEEHTSELQSLR